MDKKWYIQGEFFGLTKKNEKKLTTVIVLTRRDSLKSAPYLRLKHIQGTTIGNIWKKLFFFQKKLFVDFFYKKSIFEKVAQCQKSQKRGHSSSINVFTSRKLQKNARGYPLIESENFRKKSRIVPKKKQNEKKLWSRIYFWKLSQPRACVGPVEQR